MEMWSIFYVHPMLKNRFNGCFLRFLRFLRSRRPSRPEDLCRRILVDSPLNFLARSVEMEKMETMHFFIVQLSLSLRTKILCISGVPMNDLAPMKNCPGGGGAR